MAPNIPFTKKLYSPEQYHKIIQELKICSLCSKTFKTAIIKYFP